MSCAVKLRPPQRLAPARAVDRAIAELCSRSAAVLVTLKTTIGSRMLETRPPSSSSPRQAPLMSQRVRVCLSLVLVALACGAWWWFGLRQPVAPPSDGAPTEAASEAMDPSGPISVSSADDAAAAASERADASSAEARSAGRPLVVQVWLGEVGVAASGAEVFSSPELAARSSIRSRSAGGGSSLTRRGGRPCLLSTRRSRSSRGCLVCSARARSRQAALRRCP